MNLRAFQASRTMTALMFTVLAVAAPCTAWYVVGAREAHRRAAELESAPRRQAREVAARLAERLRDRLETLRARESDRPFYHYQNFYHDPRGAYEGIAVVPSPLAQGPIDPLIRTYFQLEPSGRFNLPQLVPFTEPGHQPAGPDTEDLKALRQQLELQAPTYVAVVREDVQQQLEAPAPTDDKESVAVGRQRATKNEEQAPAQPALGVGPVAVGVPQRRVETLDETAWVQNVQASEVYRSLRQQQVRATPEGAEQLGKLKGGKGTVQITVGPLQWHTILINKTLSLLALRDVETPQGRIIQGFLISRDGITDVLQASPFPAQFVPGPPVAAIDMALSLDGNPWHVTVDAQLNLADARAQAEAVWRDFLRLFCGGVAIASVAGVFVVWLVWQSERLARQRSQFAASAAHELRT
ncbi:hypothetical protein HQ590_08350, partial [bacterium]|nr:hypothetical protein [bacterium]